MKFFNTKTISSCALMMNCLLSYSATSDYNVNDIVHEIRENDENRKNICFKINNDRERLQCYKKYETLGLDKCNNITKLKDAAQDSDQQDILCYDKEVESYIEPQPSPHMSEAWRGF